MSFYEFSHDPSCVCIAFTNCTRGASVQKVSVWSRYQSLGFIKSVIDQLNFKKWAFPNLVSITK